MTNRHLAMATMVWLLGACDSPAVAPLEDMAPALPDMPCEPEDDATLCAHFDRQCGVPALRDRCGTLRTVSCGACSGGALCDPASGRCSMPATTTCDGSDWCWEQPSTFGGAGAGLAVQGDDVWTVVGSLLLRQHAFVLESLPFPGRLPFAPIVSDDGTRLTIGVRDPARAATGNRVIEQTASGWVDRFVARENESLDQVMGTSPDDVWITTRGPYPRITHWNGEEISSLYLAGPIDALAVVGPQLALSLIGRTVNRWTIAGPADLPELGADVTIGPAPTLVGWGETDAWLSPATKDGVVGVLVFANGVWTHHPEIPVADRFAGASPNDVWAVVGDALLHFDGTTWSEPHPSKAHGRCTSLVVAGDAVWAQWADGSTLQWNGTEWLGVVWPPALTGRAAAISTGDTGQLYVGGDGLFRIDAKSDTEESSVAISPIVPPLAGREIRKIYNGADHDVWAVVSESRLMHCAPNATMCDVMTTTTQVRDVYGANVDEVYFVGDHGLVLVWNGEKLIQLASYTEENLVDVDGSADGDVWALSDQGHVWRRISFFSLLASPPEGLAIGVATFGTAKSYIVTWNPLVPTLQVWRYDEATAKWKLERTIADAPITGPGVVRKGRDGRLYILTTTGVVGETGRVEAKLPLRDVAIGDDGTLRGLADDFSILRHAPITTP